jgi:hypothetical protein
MQPRGSKMLAALESFMKAQSSVIIGDHTEDARNGIKVAMTYPHNAYIKFDKPFEFEDYHVSGVCINGKYLNEIV